MKDFAGNELKVGQQVICLTRGASSSWMIWGEIIGFTPQKVRIKHTERYRTDTGYLVENEDIFLRDPDNVVIPLQPGWGPPAGLGSSADENFSEYNWG